MKIPELSFVSIDDPELLEFLNWIRIAINKGKIAFGTASNGLHGQNIEGEYQIVTDTGLIDTEFTVAHTLGIAPTTFLQMSINKGGVCYKSGTAWTSTNAYFKCTVANANVTLFLIP